VLSTMLRFMRNKQNIHSLQMHFVLDCHVKDPRKLQGSWKALSSDYCLCISSSMGIEFEICNFKVLSSISPKYLQLYR
jgi:hypothetical protein